MPLSYRQSPAFRLKPELGSQLDPFHPLVAGSNLKACWLFNEGAGSSIYDLTGKGNNASIPSSYKFGATKFGSGLIMPASTPNITTPTVAITSVAGAPFTVEVWILPTTSPSAVESNIISGHARMGITTANLVQCDIAGTITSNTALVNGKWHDIVLTYASGVAKIYINGNLDQTTSVGATDTFNITNLGSQFANFNASYDLIRAWGDYAATQTDVLSLYSDPFQMMLPLRTSRLLKSAAVAAAGSPYRNRMMGVG